MDASRRQAAGICLLSGNCASESYTGNCCTVVAGLMEQILDIRQYDVQRTMVRGRIALRRPQH
ncbi:MAG: hypothetical protein ACUVSF_09815 [Anaerolineae bacterium]